MLQLDRVDCRRPQAIGVRLIEIDRRIAPPHCPPTPANPIHRPPIDASSPGFLGRIIPDRGNRRKEYTVDVATRWARVAAAGFHQSVVASAVVRSLNPDAVAERAPLNAVDVFME